MENYQESEVQWPTETMRYEAEWDMEGERHPKCKRETCDPDCMERGECTLPVWHGHMWCGMCPDHDRPRHDCGCPQ